MKQTNRHLILRSAMLTLCAATLLVSVVHPLMGQEPVIGRKQVFSAFYPETCSYCSQVWCWNGFTWVPSGGVDWLQLTATDCAKAQDPR